MKMNNVALASIPIKEQLLCEGAKRLLAKLRCFNSYKGTIVIERIFIDEEKQT